MIGAGATLRCQAGADVLAYSRRHRHHVPGAVIFTRLSSDEAFLASPRGRHVVGPNYAYFCVDETFYGFAMWGTPTVEDVTRLCRLMRCELEPGVPRHQSLVHFGAVDRVDAAAFQVLRTHVDQNTTRLAEQISGQSIVFGQGGISSMVVAGYLHVFPPPYPSRAFGATRDAIAWMFPQRLELVDHVEAILEIANGVPPLVAQLRALIEVDMPHATLDRAAQSLACTARTLQRRLHGIGTTFQREYGYVQLARAKQLLAETDTKIAVVGLEVGFASGSHFSSYFRRRTGRTPQEWRNRR